MSDNNLYGSLAVLFSTILEVSYSVCSFPRAKVNLFHVTKIMEHETTDKGSLAIVGAGLVSFLCRTLHDQTGFAFNLVQSFL